MVWKCYLNPRLRGLGVLVETRCVGQTLGPQLAGNKRRRCVSCIIVSVLCPLEGRATPDPHIWGLFRDLKTPPQRDRQPPIPRCTQKPRQEVWPPPRGEDWNRPLPGPNWEFSWKGRSGLRPRRLHYWKLWETSPTKGCLNDVHSGRRLEP